MITLVAANSNPLLHYLAGRYPRKIGWMVSPPTGFFEPKEWLPYAIDNGKYAAYSGQTEWDEGGFFDMLDKYRMRRYEPEWVAVPDEVGDWRATESLYHLYEMKLKRYGWPLAFVAQDGCTPKNVPKSAAVVFMGGTTNWKWRNVALFCATFPRVHVGRVNWWDKLEYCERVGCESVDGSGFFREGDGSRVQQLVDFVSGVRRHPEQGQLFAA